LFKLEGKTVKKICLIMFGALLGSLLLFVLALFGVTLTYPLHASCKITWFINSPCTEVSSRLISQMNAWDNANCPNVSESCPKMPCGQKCLYHFKETTSDGEIVGTHATPVKRYIDNLSFKFMQTDAHCQVDAFSTSSIWYAILDFGTNYCNLRNLLDGTGLSNSLGFEEETSTSVCTQYDSIDCSRY
jgi:hypothetical protein